METLLGPMVQVVLDKVCTAMLNRAQVIANFEDQFEQLKKGLTTTNDLLAKAMDLQSKYDEVMGALSQLREVIDKADDVLTDCLVRVTYKENKSSLRFWFHDPGFKLRVGKQLKDINTKMDVARNTLGEHLKIANSTAPDRTHNGESHENQSESTWEFMSRNYDPGVTYGLDNYIKSLKEWMLGSTKGKLDFAGIVGMGGLGKTTIAKMFFNDPEVVSHFDKMIWVPVSRNFSAQRILKCMLEKANLQAPDVLESDNMFTSLKRLKDQAYLIVMDDVWHNPNLYSFWTNLRDSLPKTVKKSSCIIITTRNIEVANRLVDQDSLKLQPDTLNEKDSWALFSRVAFQSTEVTELFKEAGRAIVNKCGGLPLAIKTVGGYLAKESLFKWTETIEKFHSLAINNEETESLMLCLQVSYNELPTEMKQCLLCLSVYPEDVEIHADQLLHWWFVEGLIRSKKGNSKTALELGYEYLAKLANRCLLEVAETRGYDGRIYKFKIHDMIRELIIRIAEKEKFCNFNEECRQIQIEESRWLCITEDMAAEVETPWIKSNSSNSKLRALLLMSSPSMIDFTKKFVLLESLRVLDFSYSKLDVIIVEDSSTASSGIRVEKLFDMITSLKRLACLNLSGVQKLLEVPSSIEKLLNLQVLVLNGCINLGKIHAKITSLKRLVVLDIGTCPLEHLPRDLGRLSDLQELSGFRVVSRAKTWGCTLLQLGRLKQLRVLRITIGNVAEISEEEKKSLSSLQNLKVLAIDAADTNKQENLEMIDELELPPKIEELYLRNYRSRKMPNWFSPLRLPKLHYLSIEDCDVESLKDNYSWKIEGLYLKLLEMLKVDWNDLKRTMPALRYMEISKCSNLRNFPIDVVKKAVWRK
ncbi:putative P-loop containing nucleoside triphosphate hydrolase, leucine-rich repeat domain, L [Rosa chinensis]|uniref:Putative P-loop containing nucleoside triphosphate hydrolase, leucine-rich repeat domain, L n=1 Tax=Rosa chinensis TaxID=74649 RepID=A0A2P6RF32_ROSCH|nr:disease resistance RPP13-like protein 4 [Rosa chinensis]XP_024191349.1 disease resistance RPP13-like protein 4 [Rosa chinensis]XP_024191350.1 disease resistance RPP13-like protein 4 [Rosa chinensis]XP_024191351.1 disease resistance RPP13-like protein 4 [Rosa chinensis]PRQ45043.1 putative P-loop containing nucleoside triphosphate hydrolase, leucine-rich repeat domain, L [Rosa chinensis]